MIAFRPIRESVSEDGTTMAVKFHWMPTCIERLPKEVAGMEIPFNECPYSPEERHRILACPPPNMAIYQQERKIEIHSGYIFYITTTDLFNKPLPSVDLLELQWNLTRIAAMKRGAEYQELDSDSEGDKTGPQFHRGIPHMSQEDELPKEKI